MTQNRHWPQACGFLFCTAFGLTLAVAADFEVTGPDGRRILLKDDKTWQYVEDKGKSKDKAATASKGPEPPKIEGEAVLSLERRTEATGGCVFGLRLVNSFPHIIQSLFPTFSALRANGVIYDSVSAGFQALKPGDTQNRDMQFRGISCKEIVHVQVSGGDRCVMGDLDRFTFDEGVCLSRVRIVPSTLVRFDRKP